MIGDSDDGYVLDSGDSREIRALFCVGAGLFRRVDLKAWAGLPKLRAGCWALEPSRVRGVGVDMGGAHRKH